MLGDSEYLDELDRLTDPLLGRVAHLEDMVDMALEAAGLGPLIDPTNPEY